MSENEKWRIWVLIVGHVILAGLIWVQWMVPLEREDALTLTAMIMVIFFCLCPLIHGPRR